MSTINKITNPFSDEAAQPGIKKLKTEKKIGRGKASVLVAYYLNNLSKDAPCPKSGNTSLDVAKQVPTACKMEKREKVPGLHKPVYKCYHKWLLASKGLM